MIILIRIFPVLMPVIYFFILKSLFFVSRQWYLLLLLAVLLLNIVYFFLLYLKRKRKRVWFLLIYAEIFSVAGFLYILLLSNPVFINLFLLTWSVIYLIYLESIFNYLHQTKKFFLIELKNITAYINLVLEFILAFSLIYLNIFLNFSWWLALLIYFAISFILVFDRFLVFETELKANILYSSVIAFILTQIMGSLLWWPISVYVSAIILSVIYYVLSSLSLLSFQEKLKEKIVWRYLMVAGIVLFVVLATAQWT